MQKIVNFFRGSVRLEVKGAFPERFINLCAQRRISFWAVEWLDAGTLRLTVARQDARRAKTLGEKVMCEVTQEGAKGAPSFLARFRKRYALLAGLVLSLTAVCILSQFILTVEVSGNSETSAAQILAELRRLGVKPGAYGPGIDPAATAQELLLRVDDLSWCAVNLKGTVAEVLVRERIKRPELLNEDLLGDVVAEAPGIVTHMEVLGGEAAVKEGDTVLAGEVLIAGNIHMEGAKYSGIDLGWRQVKAQGRVYARTWRTLSAEIPLEATAKVYTGEEKNFWALEILGRRINFYRNTGISFAEYDKINNMWTAKLPGGRRMPLALVRETVRAYEPEKVPVDRDAAENLLRERLDAALREALGDGEVIGINYTAKQADGMLTVQMQAECREEIGKFVPFAGQDRTAQP